MSDSPESARAILRQLVAFSTVSSDSNLDLIAWVEAYFNRHGVTHERVQETREGVHKTSLLARIGPDVEGGIVLSGHTDVVPVMGQQWTGGIGPAMAFTLTERDGKLYGRGAADMKGFIALALAHVPEFLKLQLKRPVWFALTYDEEIGCRCAEPMAQEFIARAIRPQLIVVGEPTSMQVVSEHKGIDSFETVITGREGHSSAPQDGINAAYIMAELLLTLRELNEAERLNTVGANPYPTPHTTIHAGIANAGTARNIIPGNAVIRWEVRPLPGVHSSAVLARYHAKVDELLARYPGCRIATHSLTHVHGLKNDPTAAHIALATYLAGSNGPPMAVSYATEGGAFGERGFPTVICGPGSIDQAHGPDEFISLDQFHKGAGMMVRVGEVLSAG